MKKNIRICLNLFVFFCLSFSFAARGIELTVGVVPQFPLSKIYGTWNPVLKAISASTSINFSLKPYATIPEFEKAILSGDIDVAYMNPYHVVMANKSAGYIPIIRDDKQRLTGILVVRKDSPIQRLSELEGKTIVFPSPNAFGASLYMRALLSEKENIHYKSKYISTHSNVYRHVVSGLAAAGGAIRATLTQESAAIQSDLRVLYETPAAYPHPIVVHPKVPENIRAQLQDTFIALSNTKEGKLLLSQIQISKPVKTSFTDYAPLAELGLDKYVVLNGN